MNKITISLLILSTLLATPCLASNRLYADNTLEASDGFTWDWSFGAGYYVDKHYLQGVDYQDGFELNINVAINYDKFYFDVDNSQLSGGLTIGYNLVDKYDWSLDLFAINAHEGFDETGTFYDDDLVSELRGVKEREDDFNAGLRLTRKEKTHQLSLEILHDISGAHKSLWASGFISTIQDYRNWEFRVGSGLNIYSSDFTGYYFGVDANETIAGLRPQYNPSAAYSLTFEIHAEYPINEDWVFLGGWLSSWYSKEISNSPLISNSLRHKAKVGIRYVF